MSRIGKWKLEKTKVKVVFRLQFHATHIPQSGWDKLYISFVPADTGKVTAKTTKANVRNGTCKWADPIYETTRLLQDTRTKQYDEKLYKLVVATGSSRSSILGEANIDLSDYADALKPCTVALPLQGCDFGTVLHVTVQLLTSKTGFREFEQQRELRERGMHTANSQDDSPAGKVPSGGGAVDQTDKVNARVKFKPETKDLTSPMDIGLNDESADSAAGFDGSSNTSESLHAEKLDASSMPEIDSLKRTFSGELAGNSLGQSPQAEKGHTSVQAPNDWAHGWSSDYSADNDLAVVYEENSRLRGSLEVAESSIHELKMEVSSLRSQADQIGFETQTFANNLAAEITSGEELVKEVAKLKSECSKLKEDLEWYKGSNLVPTYTDRGTAETYQNYLIQDLKFRWLKGLLLVEDKIRELQSKACFGLHEKELRFLNSDFEALLGILQDLKGGSGEAASSISSVHSGGASIEKIGEMSTARNVPFVAPMGLEADLCQPGSLLRCVNILSQVSHDSNSLNSATAMNGRNFELLRELDALKAERETVVRKMDQMECYYEALIQELEENRRQMLGELQNLRNEHSTCVYSISSAKAEIETMRYDMNEQKVRFTEDKRQLESINKELERRALKAEASLRRARLNYSIAVGQLQKDLELLSCQVLSMHETNESLIRQTFPDSSDLCIQGSPEIALSQTVGLREYDDEKHTHCKNQYVAAKKQQLGGDILLDDLKKSLHSPEELYRKVEEEVYEMQMVNVYLDVFSKALQQTLIDACLDVTLMKDGMDELKRQLELSDKAKDLLTLKLQAAMNDIHSLKEYNSSCVTKCKEMALEKQNLEANIYKLTCENHHVAQKISEMELGMAEYMDYKSKYEECVAEKTELSNLLESETMEKNNLRNTISNMTEELATCKEEYSELASLKENLQNTVNSLQDKLHSMLISYDSKLNEMSTSNRTVIKNIACSELSGILSGLDVLQQTACDEIFQLKKEKAVLDEERDIARESLQTAETNIVTMKQQYDYNLRGMVDKLDLSITQVQKLESKLEAVSHRLDGGSEAEEKYEQQQQKEILADLDRLEFELQQLTSTSRETIQEIIALETINEELEQRNSAMTVLTEKNQTLVKSLEDKNEECSQLALELNNLKNNLQYLQEELYVERNQKDALESTFRDLSLQLNDERCKLVHFEQLETEVVQLKHLVTDLEAEKSRIYSQLDDERCQLVHFKQLETEMVQLKQLVSDLEAEKSRIYNRLLYYEGCLKSTSAELSSISGVEMQLAEMHESAIAADVEFVYTKFQQKAYIEELEKRLSNSGWHLAELHQRNSDVETKLKHLLVREKHLIEENTRLLTSLDSLKSELAASVKQNKVLDDKNGILSVEVEKYKDRLEALEDSHLKENIHFAPEIERLKQLLACSEDNVIDLIHLKEELEIQICVLKAKLDEQCAQMNFLEGYNDELMRLRNQCSELSHQLSEQTLKTEEFKNLAAHLKELKDKADAECSRAREQREAEGPPVAMQESLRIAFIKEQYETKVQDLKHQLSMSRRHSEEMLLKLQDAIDEVENRKKCEASHLKKNEELESKVSELEAELHSLISDKRETMKDYDKMKAQLECTLLSLECCKEEKQKVEASLEECSVEKSKIAAELDMTNRLLESLKSSVSHQREGSDLSNKEACIDHESIGSTESDRKVINGFRVNNPLKDSDSGDLSPGCPVSCKDAEHACSVSIDGGAPSKSSLHELPEQDVPSQSVNENSNLVHINQENVLHTKSNRLALINDHSKAESLWSSMDHLSKELERMRNDNSLLPQDNYLADADFPELERELMQLRKVNEELRSIYPMFTEFSGRGNALERVLALEIELAEALQSKKKSIIQFQSSFLKQHSDEEAIFQSFRDINELIRDLLELKARYRNVETELKDMHERYSQLSLQFAEVEGERQKLMMTLRNIRSHKKTSNLNISSSASIGDHSL